LTWNKPDVTARTHCTRACPCTYTTFYASEIMNLTASNVGYVQRQKTRVNYNSAGPILRNLRGELSVVYE